MVQVIQILIAVFLMGPISAWAETQNLKTHEHKEKHAHKNDKATAEFIDAENLIVKVKGMVCAFCAQGVEKQFNSREEVETTKVNLDTMEVHVKLKKGKTLSEDI